MGIKAHFDCSGQNASKVLTVGGYLSWDKTREQIEKDWNMALVEGGYCEQDGKPGIFHLFEKYYSFDGTSEALLKEIADHQSYVANKSHFEQADRKLVVTVRRNPKILERRLKRKLPKF